MRLALRRGQARNTGAAVLLVVALVAADGGTAKNKFLAREPVDADTVPIGMEPPDVHDLGRHACPAQMSVSWSREMDASIYTTPVLSDMDGDGEKELVVTTYAQFVDVISAKTGHSKPGWPFSMAGANYHSSPLVADVDGDGTLEVVAVTFNGDVLVFGKDGVPYLSRTLKLPKLKVRRDWYLHLTSFDSGVAPVEFVDAHVAEELDVVHKLRSGVNDVHSQSSRSRGPILPLSENAKEATVSMPFSEEGVESFQELFSMPQRLVDVGSEEIAEPLQVVVDDDVLVDGHVLGSPVLTDLDGDGHQDLVVAVSYFFDRDTFDYSAFEQLGLDVDLRKYVAGGLVVVDLQTMTIKWATHLDLTTEDDELKAYIYSTPTVADIDADGDKDVVVGTSMGLLYVLNSKGEVRDGFPVSMAEIQGQVAVHDVDRDGKLDLIACDSNSNVVVFNSEGEEIWDARLAGLSAHGAVMADVDGDGLLDVVITTSLGFVFALNASNGETLANFPVKMGQRIISPVLPLRVRPDQAHHSLIVPCFDGHLYVIDATTRCIDSVDVGEHAYTMVLADDVTGNGRMELFVTTMNGMVYCLSTNIPFHPLRAWPSQNHLLNGFAPRDGHVGVRIEDSMRERRDVTGSHFHFAFEIVDKRPLLDENKDNVAYSVRITVGQQELFVEDYVLDGKYMVRARTPPARMAGVVRLELVDQHQLVYTDSCSMSFNLHFHKAMKWILVAPFAAMFAGLVLVKRLKAPLPL